MKQREFAKLLRSLLPELKGGEPVAVATPEMRQAMLLFVVRRRGPIHPAFITPLADQAWLACCGYPYRERGYWCTCENRHLVPKERSS